MEDILQIIKNMDRLIISTHIHPDGDGLGAGIALSLALQNLGKSAPFLILDPLPKKYHFLLDIYSIETFHFNTHEELLSKCQGAIFLDTNDLRLLEPLYSIIKSHVSIHFIDHHPILNHGPRPEDVSYLDQDAASTGELVYYLIRALGVPIDDRIAAALYTSITFDTQLYRYIRNSPQSHRIAAELLEHNIQAEKIHRSLFAHQTPQKISFLAKALNEIEYMDEGKIALLLLKKSDIDQYKIDQEESRDIIDMIMNIEQLEVAVLIREDKKSIYKISLRSKGKILVLPLAEALGGGGHLYSSGAYFNGDYIELRTIISHYLNNFVWRCCT